MRTPRSRSGRPWHLRTQLSVGVIAAVFTAYALTAWLLIPTSKGLVLDRVDARLVDDLPAVSAAVAAESRTVSWDRDYRIVVRDGGSVTPFAHAEPLPAAEVWQRLPLTGPDTAAYADVGDETYRYLGVDLDGGQELIVAAPVDDLAGLVDTMINLFLVIGGSATALLGGVTWWWLRRGLRPLEALAGDAAAVAAGRPGAGLTADARSREVSELVDALNRMLDSLHGALRAREVGEERMRTFVADAGHELRTPLTILTGYLELDLHGGLPERAEHDEAVGRALSEARRMRRILADMQTLAELDSEPGPAGHPVDVVPVVRSVVADFAAVDPQRTYRLHLPEDSPLLAVADGDALRQVVTNLLSNVARHTPTGTTADLSVQQNGPTIRISLADDGPGVPVDRIPHMTERFWRLDASRSRRTGGSGLGLAIVAGILDRHHGQLRISSRAPSGLQITVDLPRAVTGTPDPDPRETAAVTA